MQVGWIWGIGSGLGILVGFIGGPVGDRFGPRRTLFVACLLMGIAGLVVGGMFFCVAEIGGVAGLLLMGVLMDLTGTFMAGALFLAGLCMAITVFTRFLNHHPESY